MYLPIGGDMAVRSQSILGIFDLDNTTCSKHTRELLRRAEELGAVVDVLAFIPGGPARVLLALALLTAATVSGAALLLRGSVRQTA